MHDGIDPGEQLFWEYPHVPKVLLVEKCLGKRLGTSESVAEVTRVKPDNVSVRSVLSDKSREDGPHVTHVSGD